MRYTVYIDESGNTGEPRYKNEKWNWGNNPYFSLGAIWLPSENVNLVKEKMNCILTQMDPKLGNEKEWKSTANYPFNKRLMKLVIELLFEVNAGYFIDITDKYYKIITYLVEYCIFPYYMLNQFSENFLNTLVYDQNYRNQKIEMCNKLYCSNETESFLIQFEELCHSGIENDDVYKQYLCFVNELKIWLWDLFHVDISNVMNCIQNYQKYNLERRNVVPLMDYSTTNKPLCFTPNIDAYNNIISNIIVFDQRVSEVDVVHDEQHEFESPIRKWTEHLKKECNFESLKTITFHNSKGSIIQLIDFVVGRISKIYDEVINNKEFKNSDEEWIDIIKPLMEHVNVVAPQVNQNKFFSRFKLITVQSKIPL